MDRQRTDDESPLDISGRRRSPVTFPGFRKGKLPGNFGKKYPPETFTPQEILALMEACGRHPLGTRNRALIALLWRTGLRISEALSITEQDLRPSTQTVRVRVGKSPGVVGMDEWGWQQITPWLEMRKRYPVGPVFCVVEGPTKGGSMRSAYFRTALKGLSKKAGVTRRVTPHGFRHTLAAELAFEGFDLLHIQRQLRHKSLAATAAYLTGIAPAATVNAIRARRPAWLEDDAA